MSAFITLTGSYMTSDPSRGLWKNLKRQETFRQPLTQRSCTVAFRAAIIGAVPPQVIEEQRDIQTEGDPLSSTHEHQAEQSVDGIFWNDQLTQTERTRVVIAFHYYLGYTNSECYSIIRPVRVRIEYYSHQITLVAGVTKWKTSTSGNAFASARYRESHKKNVVTSWCRENE